MTDRLRLSRTRGFELRAEKRSRHTWVCFGKCTLCQCLKWRSLQQEITRGKAKGTPLLVKAKSTERPTWARSTRGATAWELTRPPYPSAAQQTFKGWMAGSPPPRRHLYVLPGYPRLPLAARPSCACSSLPFKKSLSPLPPPHASPGAGQIPLCPASQL